MRSRLKLLVPAIIVLAVVVAAVVFALAHHHKSVPKSQQVTVKSCSLLSPADAAKYLGPGTFLAQARASTVDNVKVVGCQYNSKTGGKSIVIGQKTAATSYGTQVLSKEFFSSATKNEAEIKFAGYTGFINKNQSGEIRIWFKNTWLQVFSPNQTLSQIVLTHFVKTH